MKVSISLSSDDVEFLDDYTRTHRSVASRSAALQRAVALLRASELSAAYALAWDDWADDGATHAWDSTIGDGLSG